MAPGPCHPVVAHTPGLKFFILFLHPILLIFLLLLPTVAFKSLTAFPTQLTTMDAPLSLRGRVVALVLKSWF